ncbi:DUF3107 family protein [Nanchangia anserum]|uniref:DUF3107 family protein n=1 Tax=Nanchangia anserum TaxID=2692125 RepID=A0A8I0GDW9_9ACTO|nr:DUF3107 family protein [Nanchangia anserum]MBD3690176.1 DUF3107 family protein [Nanchangia anserum]QOX82369.1 DUF3107 family protein [Nanchangia anserum]
MQIHVGTTGPGQQLNLTVDMTADELAQVAEANQGDSARAITLREESGRSLIIAPRQLSYIEILPERTQKVGFGVG